MKGNIFSIEAIISIIIVISVVGIIYNVDNSEVRINFSEIKFNSEKINLFYFNEIEDNSTMSENLICDKILYYTDQNIVSQKNICKVVK